MKSTVLLALAAVTATLGACRDKHADRDAAHDGGRPARPAPLAMQLPPTLDRWRPWATLYTGDRPDVAVVLVHQLGSHRGEWSSLVARLQAGVAVTTLTLDLRGHGDSVRGPRDERVTWESFGTEPERWMAMAYDVIAAVQYLRAQGASRVAVVGSSIGGTAAVLAATGTLPPGAPPMPSDALIDAVALLSPGTAYHGVDIREPMQAYLAQRRPLLMFAGELDGASAEAVSVLAPVQGAGITRGVFAGARQHGVALCNADPARWQEVDLWVRQSLGITPRPAGPTPDGG